MKMGKSSKFWIDKTFSPAYHGAHSAGRDLTSMHRPQVPVSAPFDGPAQPTVAGFDPCNACGGSYDQRGRPGGQRRGIVSGRQRSETKRLAT